MYYIPYEEAVRILSEKLCKRGCAEEDAYRVAEVVAGNSLEGVYSHGINRFKRLLLSIDNKIADVSARAERKDGFGAFERWDGNGGLGILNALDCSDRAIALAKEHGIGCVALRNTNHWFRAGTYGFRIAKAGMYGAVFTNTKSNTVYYGTLDTLLGTTPLVLAIPRKEGPVVADVALVEYSYGKLETAAREGKLLPTMGGYDLEGNLSNDPKKIMPANRVLPLGRWKGSALSLALDLAGAAMSLGNTACDIRELPGDEHAVSQVYIAINSRAVNSSEDEEEIIERTLQKVLSAKPINGSSSPRYPGQNSIKTREQNLRDGIPVDESVWDDILAR